MSELRPSSLNYCSMGPATCKCVQLCSSHIATFKVLNFVKDKVCALLCMYQIFMHQHVHVCKPV